MLLAPTRRDRVAALALVVALAGVCWAWLGKMIWDMAAMPADGGTMAPSPAGPGYLAWLILMWLVMMAAMMLPSALPMTLAFADFARPEERRAAVPPTPLFVAGYVSAWGAFSLAAGIGQWALEVAGAMSPSRMALKHEAVAGWVLMAAGLYQWTPLKHACLRRCRTPFGFLLTEWRDGPAGALVMGWRHGLFCVGCCWALMALLLVAGVMNPLWIVMLTLFVVVEKVAPHGDRITRAAGLGLLLAGAWLAFF